MYGWTNKGLFQSVVLPSTLMTTECSLEGEPCPLFVWVSIHVAKKNIHMLCSVFSVVTSTAGLSIILALSKMYSLLRIMCHLWWTMSRTIQLRAVISLLVDVQLRHSRKIAVSFPSLFFPLFLRMSTPLLLDIMIYFLIKHTTTFFFAYRKRKVKLEV